MNMLDSSFPTDPGFSDNLRNGENLINSLQGTIETSSYETEDHNLLVGVLDVMRDFHNQARIIYFKAELEKQTEIQKFRDPLIIESIILANSDFIEGLAQKYSLPPESLEAIFGSYTARIHLENPLSSDSEIQEMSAPDDSNLEKVERLETIDWWNSPSIEIKGLTKIGFEIENGHIISITFNPKLAIGSPSIMSPVSAVRIRVGSKLDIQVFYEVTPNFNITSVKSVKPDIDYIVKTKFTELLAIYLDDQNYFLKNATKKPILEEINYFLKY